MKKFFNFRKNLLSEDEYINDEDYIYDETADEDDSDYDIEDEDGDELDDGIEYPDGNAAESYDSMEYEDEDAVELDDTVKYSGRNAAESYDDMEDLGEYSADSDRYEDGSNKDYNELNWNKEDSDENVEEFDESRNVSGEGVEEAEDDIDEPDEEIEDEDENTEESEDDMEESDEDIESDGESWEERRRIYRRKRRIRNQIIAYGVVIIILVVLILSGISIGHRISGFVKEKLQNDDQSMQLEEEQDLEGEDQNEEIIVEAPPEIEERTLEEQLEEIVNNCISVMPLQDKVAGLFVITPEALTGVGTVIQAGEGTQEALNNYAVGGLIYFSQNIQDKEQLSQMLDNTVAMSKYPIFLAVDEEGGSVSRVASSSIDVAQVDDMQTIGAAGDTTVAYEAGVTIGSYLNEIGFNLDFAPVADVVTDAANSSLGNRAFSDDPEVCADMVANIVEGIQGTSVSTCLKHFPGIGSSNEDTHDGKVETSKTLEEMRTSDFIPFKAGIEAGADLVMVGHITASAVDEDGVPSSISKIMITDVLRGELGFDGVVITDALNMSAVSDYYTSEEAAIYAILAGADMLLMPEDFEEAYNGVLTAVQDGRISEERIDESLRRIYRIKYADKLDMD